MKRVLFAAAAALFLAGPALAAVTPNSLVTGQTPKNAGVALVTGTLTGTVYTGGTNGSKCFGLYTTNNDTSAETLTINLFDGTHTFPVVVITTVIAAGTANGTPSQSLMTPSVWAGLPVDGNNNPFIYLQSGWSMTAVAGAVTSAKAINLNMVCQDF